MNKAKDMKDSIQDKASSVADKGKDMKDTAQNLGY